MTKETMSEADRRALQRWADALNEGKPDEIVVFTQEEAEVLKECAKVIIAWRTLGRWWPSARSVILSLATVLGFLASLKAGVFEGLGIMWGGK